VNEA
jgi:hypothetical protein